MPYLEGFPPGDEMPALAWITKSVSSLVRILLGAVRGTVGIGEIIEALSDPARARNFVGRISDIIGDAKVNERPVDIGDYVDLHAFPMQTPQAVEDYDEDEAFARQRLQGANCVVIEKCTEVTRKKLKILDSDPSYNRLKAKVDSLMAAGKLFVVDHDLLKDMEPSPLDGDIPRYLAASIALFEVVEDDLLPIRPIGLQLSQGKTATPIFTPDDGFNWQIAKACFEAADFIVHEVISHLGNTHLVLEGPMVAMHRQLPKEHPIHVLLEPHVEGTAFINWGAQELLIVKGGGVDRLQANNVEDSWTMVLEQTLARMSKDFSPGEDFKARGVTKEELPGRYPYRDSGLKYWEATHTWVKDYLDIYYQNDVDISNDYELKAFVDELVNIGQMTWLKEIDTSADKKGLLAKVLASLIYSASALHAAVNFPQKPRVSFVPNTPGSVYAPPPTDKEERTMQDYLNYLPPLEIATSQVVLSTLLGSVFHTKLGDYETHQFSDKRVEKPLARFQQAIEDIEVDMVDENAYVVAAWRKRGKGKKNAANFAYTTLLPDNVPQSINI
eukprot:jgi/Undpi1/4767/HiC_scaffold_18.g08120.m1